jgi:hypothetical protein
MPFKGHRTCHQVRVDEERELLQKLRRECKAALQKADAA